MIGVLGFNDVYTQEDFKSKGISSFHKRDYNNSIRYLTKTLSKGDSSWDVFYYRGLSRLYLNDFENAQIDFNIAIEKGCTTADVYNNRGLTYLYMGEFKLALDDFNKAISIDSTFAEAYTNRATTNIEIGELEDALSDLNKSLKYNSNNISTYYELGRVYYKMKNYEDAIKNFDKCIKLNFKSPKVYYNRGNAYFKLGKYKKAIEDYTKCLSLDSTDTEALNNRAVAYEKLGMLEEAKADRKRLSKLLGNENLFMPIEEITYNEVTDTLHSFKLAVPSHWKVLQKMGNDYSEMVITPENIKSDTDYYSIGIKLSFNRNMSSLYNVKTSGEILEFWRGSVEKNSKDYYFYKYLQQKLFTRGDYTGNLYETLVQYWDNSPVFQSYELALAKDDVLFFGFFQSPANQFSYFRLIFDKIIESLTFLK
jgi:tetratricopeptide (TPR) repeat protein